MLDINESEAMHTEDVCAGEPCPWHNPSDHNMRDWPISIRYDKYCLVERHCAHGIGHPDPDSAKWVAETWPENVGDSIYIHGCDGCCG